MKLAASVVLGVLAATVAAGSDDAKAPLAESQQQLRQLQRDQATAKSGAADTGLKGSVPELQVALPARDDPSATALNPNQRPKERERKPARDKNWLVDGYNRLGGEHTAVLPGDQPRNGADAAQDDGGKSGDHDDLINLYGQQSKPGDPASAKGKAAEKKDTSGTAAADPMAPFLQQWLANSPVRDVVLVAHPGGSGGGAPDAPIVAGPVDTGLGGGPAGAMFSTSPASPAPVADNPYLAALTPPALPPGPPAGVQPPIFPVDPGVGPVSPDRPASAIPGDTSATGARSDLRKPPPTPADEDKKYFPQLKRF